MDKHLWEIKHDYYCEEGSYFQSGNSARQTVFNFSSFDDFLENWGNADKDYNLLFRWDWNELSCNDLPTYNGDDNYRNGILKVFFMMQRKGFHSTCLVDVCRADEPKVIEYLSGSWAHLQSLWSPISGSVTKPPSKYF
jgi:hypothetical protein